MKTICNTAIALLFTLAMITMNACSYAVDLVERAITKRASFSIEATYNPTAKTVTIQWTESGGTNFAGYEIYMTEEPDNEYAGYVVIGAPYNISSSSRFRVESSLQYGITNSFTMDFTQVNALPSKGRYFFRVGIIDWDEDADKRTVENGYTGDTLHDYTNNTDIAEISGLAMVDIY